MNIYTITAETPSKENNLKRRSNIFEKYYIPHLIKLDIFKKWDKCIELWCGQWHKLQKLINNFPEVEFSWLEKSEVMLSKAKEKLLNIEVKKWDILNLSNLNQAYDIIFLSQVLHHLDEKDRKDAYKEIFKKLKNGWYIIIIDSFRPESSVIKQKIWDITNRFYAVLSQYPISSLGERLNHAINSILVPDFYNPEDFWYFSPERNNVLWWENQELTLLHTITPKIFQNTIPCISDMLIYQKL
ncbi:MAG: hypothetical protein ACD_49C00038G0039 [uncultured bacterium (gcode 4)]|uniref:Methyltransferase domain-containing protein n=1 Tax=uncultured bacterium (gcode 4) TaxID=1234023 RepID=K2AEN8_9BACT|nr:MAG: hypothetical protein ACD_49C00038G0039 [uncultured bacterium (gcode 4)]